jgi:hypothetical protein
LLFKAAMPANNLSLREIGKFFQCAWRGQFRNRARAFRLGGQTR